MTPTEAEAVRLGKLAADEYARIASEPCTHTRTVGSAVKRWRVCSRCGVLVHQSKTEHYQQLLLKGY